MKPSLLLAVVLFPVLAHAQNAERDEDDIPPATAKPGPRQRPSAAPQPQTSAQLPGQRTLPALGPSQTAAAPPPQRQAIGAQPAQAQNPALQPARGQGQGQGPNAPAPQPVRGAAAATAPVQGQAVAPTPAQAQTRTFPAAQTQAPAAPSPQETPAARAAQGPTAAPALPPEQTLAAQPAQNQPPAAAPALPGSQGSPPPSYPPAAAPNDPYVRPAAPQPPSTPTYNGPGQGYPGYPQQTYQPPSNTPQPPAPSYPPAGYPGTSYPSQGYQQPAPPTAQPYPQPSYQPPPSPSAPSYQAQSYPQQPSYPPAPSYQGPSYPQQPSYQAPSSYPPPSYQGPSYQGPSYQAQSYPQQSSYQAPSSYLPPSYQAPSYQAQSYPQQPSYPPSPSYPPPSYQAPPSSYSQSPSYPPPSGQAPSYPPPSYPQAPQYQAPSYQATPTAPRPGDPPGSRFSTPPPEYTYPAGIGPEPGADNAAPAQPASAQVTAEEIPSSSIASLTLATSSDAARAAALACADAIDNFHLDLARARCGEALKQDDTLALAHLWLSQAAATPDQAAEELAKAKELAARSSAGERLFVEAMHAWREARIDDAQRGYDELVRILGGEKRAYVARGQFRQVALGDVESALADYRKALALDPRYAAGYNFLGFALADAGKMDEATRALEKYAELAPSEPNAFDSQATLALRRGDLAEAMGAAKKALNLDPRFLVPHGTLGDALLLGGKPKEARREYAFLEGSPDPAIHHEGTLRMARSHLFEERTADAELALIKEADWARKQRRPIDAAETFLEVARVQIERGALAEAGRGLREAQNSLKPPRPATTPTSPAAPATPASTRIGPVPIAELERLRVGALVTEMRALALASLGERGLAEARVDELAAQLKALGERQPAPRLRVLRGWIAWRVGDDQAALAALDQAAVPTMRYAYALSLARSGEPARARAIMEELSRRTANDLETALTRPRALAWLRANATASR